MSVQQGSLKLYVWRGADVLKNYGSGTAFALAYSADQARQMIQAAVLKDRDWVGPRDWMDADDREEAAEDVRRIFSFLAAEPEVFTEPVALYQMGSE